MTAVLYARTLETGFVYEDSHRLASSALSNWVWRPSRFLSDVVWWLTQSHAATLHGIALGLHLLNGVLVYALASRVRLAALVVTGLFLLHPVQVSAVAYLEGLPDLLMTGWVLGALLAYLAERKTLAIACALMACLSKESGVVVVGLLTLPALCWQRRLVLPWASVLGLGVAGLGLPLIAALWRSTPVSPVVWIGMQSWAVMQHLWTVVQPTAIRVVIGPPTDQQAVLAVAGLVALVVGCLWARGAVQFALAWLLVALSVRFVVPTYGAVLAGHQTYLPFLGVWFLIGAVWRMSIRASSTEARTRPMSV